MKAGFVKAPGALFFSVTLEELIDWFSIAGSDLDSALDRRLALTAGMQ